MFVGDRGMLTSARIDEELRPVEGLDWISALRSDAIAKLATGPLQPSRFDTTDLAEIRHPDFPAERLIACLNPLLRQERARKREALLRATEHELDKIVVATQRQRRALRGESTIGLRVGRVLGRFKMAKHFRTTITETTFGYERKTDAIAQEARLDGIYVIRTSGGRHSDYALSPNLPGAATTGACLSSAPRTVVSGRRVEPGRQGTCVDRRGAGCAAASTGRRRPRPREESPRSGRRRRRNRAILPPPRSRAVSPSGRAGSDRRTSLRSRACGR